jgi:transcriptional regulator with XRE-family HTH domain
MGADEEAAVAAERRTFAQKLRQLIATARAPNREPYSYREISACIERRGGPAISAAYIQQLATGKRVNPKIHYVEALASFFCVPAAYFFDDEVTDRVDTQLAERQALDASASGREARLMAMRAKELSPKGRQQVMDLLDLVYRVERGDRGKPAEG